MEWEESKSDELIGKRKTKNKKTTHQIVLLELISLRMAVDNSHHKNEGVSSMLAQKDGRGR